jgi:hypothetical protein
VTLAEQFARGLPRLELRRVVTGIGTQPVGRLEIDDQQRHRAFGPGLQDEAPLELDRRAEQRGQHDGLAEQLADCRRIIVLVQDLVERGAEPGQPAAQIQRADLEGQHGIVDRNRRRRANRRLGRDFDVGGL